MTTPTPRMPLPTLVVRYNDGIMAKHRVFAQDLQNLLQYYSQSLKEDSVSHHSFNQLEALEAWCKTKPQPNPEIGFCFAAHLNPH